MTFQISPIADTNMRCQQFEGFKYARSRGPLDFGCSRRLWQKSSLNWIFWPNSQPIHIHFKNEVNRRSGNHSNGIYFRACEARGL